MSDNKKLDQIIDYLDSLERKINDQNKRISNLERNISAQNSGPNIFRETEFTQDEPVKHSFARETEPRQEKPARASHKQPMSPDKKVVHDIAGDFNFKNLELNIGKYLFQIIGAGVFVVGMGFLFQYSIEQGFISPLVRVAAGFIAATVLVVGGEFSRKRQWTRALIAGGIALYYISLLAAAVLYELIPLSHAFIASMAITTLAFILGSLHDCIVITAFGLIGGFLAPIFAAAPFPFFDPENKLFMIAYLTSTTVAFMMLSLIKRWGPIAAGALFFMLLYNYTPMIIDLSLNQQLAYLLIFYASFVLLPYVYALQVNIKECIIEPCIIAAGGICSFSFLQYYLMIAGEKIHESLAPIQWLFTDATYQEIAKYLFFIFGTLCLIKTMICFAKKSVCNNVLVTLFLATILSFFGVILLHFHGLHLGIAIQTYALSMLLIGFLLRAFYVRIISLIFLGLGSWVYISNVGLFGYPYYDSLFFNDLNAATAILVLIFAASAYAVTQYKDQLEDEYKKLPKFLELGAYITVLIWLLSPLWQFPYYIVALAFYSLIVFLIGLLSSKNYLRAFSCSFLVIALLGFIFRVDYLLSGGYYNINLICGTFIAVFILAIISTKKWGRNLPATESHRIIQISELLASIFAFVCISRNLSLYTENVWYNAAVISVYYGASALLFIFLGLILEKKYIRYLGLWLSALTLWTLWFVILGMKATLNRVIIFIIVGLIFMLASFVYQRLSKDASE